MRDYLVTDNVTVVLGISLAVVYLLKSYLTPQSLVHPILLGRQSDADRVRQKGETAVYRNYGTGSMGNLPLRPAPEIKTLLDLARLDFERSSTLWSTKISNADLRGRVQALGAGFIREANLSPKESNVLVLLNDSLEFLITDLALASQSIPSFTISSLSLLSSVLESHPPSAIIVHIHFLNQLLELIAENHEYAHHTLIVVGEGDLPTALSRVQVKVLWLADLERKGSRGGAVQTAPPSPEDVFSVSFYPGPNNELKATQLTHLNLTAGVTGVRVQLPLNAIITAKDTIISSHSLATPYGRAVAYTALFEGAIFSTSDSTAVFHADDLPRSAGDDIVKLTGANATLPTVLFLTNQELNLISSSILAKAKDSFLFSFAWRHKLFALQQGYLSNDSMWDGQVFASARLATLKQASTSLRAVVAAGHGHVDVEAVPSMRIALSLPLVFAHTHPLVAGPVFSSHPLDFQAFSTKTSDKMPLGEVAHVGPPSVNTEVKLVNINDDAVESGVDPVGEVLVRGPSVTLPLGSDTAYEWVPLNEKAVIQTNGTFKIIPSA